MLFIGIIQFFNYLVLLYPPYNRSQGQVTALMQLPCLSYVYRLIPLFSKKDPEGTVAGEKQDGPVHQIRRSAHQQLEGNEGGGGPVADRFQTPDSFPIHRPIPFPNLRREPTAEC